jgi:hypothetical protein
MALHDAWLRVTPYELAIPGRAFVEEHFPSIAREAESRHVDPSDPGGFVLLASAGAALQEIKGESDDPELIRQHGALLFHAWHLWRNGERIVLAPVERVRSLVEARIEREGWEPRLPVPAGYLQLPQHMVWVRAGPADTPESLDGFFWTRSRGDTLSLLLVAGIHRDRAGFSVVEIPPLPLADAGEWLRLQGREEGRDFAPTLPGGELAGLYSVETGGEALKLAARLLLHLEKSEGWGADTGGAQERSPSEEESGAGAPIPSRLPWARVA